MKPPGWVLPGGGGGPRGRRSVIFSSFWAVLVAGSCSNRRGMDRIGRSWRKIQPDRSSSAANHHGICGSKFGIGVKWQGRLHPHKNKFAVEKGWPNDFSRLGLEMGSLEHSRKTAFSDKSRTGIGQGRDRSGTFPFWGMSQMGAERPYIAGFRPGGRAIGLGGNPSGQK